MVKPDILAIPVGNAGNITAYWQGFVEYHNKEYTITTNVWLPSRRSISIVQNKIIKIQKQ